MNKSLYTRIINNLNRAQDIEQVIPDFIGDYVKVLYVFSLSKDYVKDKILKDNHDIGNLSFSMKINFNKEELNLLASLYEYDINIDSDEYDFDLMLKKNRDVLKIKYFGFKKGNKVKKL